MSPQPNLPSKTSRESQIFDYDTIAKQLARTQQLVQASSQLRSMASSLRDEADQLRANARLLRDQ